MLRRWPFLIPFLLLAAGMALSLFIPPFSCNAAALAAAFTCVLIACFLPSAAIFSLCTGLFFFLSGLCILHPWLYPELSSHSIRTKTGDQPLTIEGVIFERPTVAPDGSRVTVQVERVLRAEYAETVSGLMLVYVSSGDVSLTRGDRVRFVSRVTVPRRLGLPGEFDFSRYLALQGIAATGRVASQGDIVLIRAAAVLSVQRTVDQAARTMGETIRQAIPDQRISSVLTALLIGDQRRIPQELADAYTRAGVNHILSISGFHIGIIAAFISLVAVWFLTRFEYAALRCNARRVAVLIAVPVMVIYLLLTGNAPATARSVIMLSVFAVALFSEREQDSINSLLCAAFFLVMFNPPTLFDVSFQLSFISLWGILIAAPLIVSRFKNMKSNLVRCLLQFGAVSAAASCVTLLPVLYIFNVASFNGILTNFLIVPLLGYGAVLSGFIALPLVTLIPSSAPLLLWPAATLVDISNRFITWCSALPVFTFHGISAVDMFFFLLFMTCVTFVTSRPLRTIATVLIPRSAPWRCIC
jgi:competence protein ComEC